MRDDRQLTLAQLVNELSDILVVLEPWTDVLVNYMSQPGCTTDAAYLIASEVAHSVVALGQLYRRLDPSAAPLEGATLPCFCTRSPGAAAAMQEALRKACVR